MIATVQPLLPIYGLIFLGFAIFRWSYIDRGALPHLSQFTLKVLLPVLIATAVSRVGALSDFNWVWIAGYAIASLTMLIGGATVLSRLLGLPRPAAWTLALGMSMSNSVFLGFPIASIVLPDIADRLFAWAMTVENMIVLPLGITLASIAEGEAKGEGVTPLQALGRTLVNTAKSPIVLGLLAGFVLAATGWQLPWVLDRVRDAIVAAAPLLALTLVGGLVASAPTSQILAPAVFAIALAKLFLHPALTYATLTLLPGIPREQALGGTLFAAIPMIATFTVFAARYGGERRAASALVVTTVLAGVTIGALVLLIG